VEGCNAARELSKHFQKPVEDHWKELERFVGYIKGNQENIRITYFRPKELHPMAMVDSIMLQTQMTGEVLQEQSSL
jgi:hypothetical protein